MDVDYWLLMIIVFILGMNIRLFGKIRIYTLLALSVIIVAYMYLANQHQGPLITLMYFGSLFLIMMALLFLSIKKLKKNNYPSAYIRTYIMVNTLRNLALLVMLGYLLVLLNPAP
jgi:uncharacterized membrane protein YoaK (UPF0700 family)